MPINIVSNTPDLIPGLLPFLRELTMYYSDEERAEEKRRMAIQRKRMDKEWPRKADGTLDWENVPVEEHWYSDSQCEECGETWMSEEMDELYDDVECPYCGAIWSLD